MNRHQRRAADAQKSRKLAIVPVGFGGLCGSCDEIHPPDPNPFVYTVGLTEEQLPELLLIAPGTDRATGEHLWHLLGDLAEFQRQRRRAFADGEHVHGPEIGNPNCVVLRRIAPADERFPLGGAIQRYGKRGYRVMQVEILAPLGEELDAAD
jgi:hypothetical protein